MDMETPGLKFNFALTAEQVVSPSESDCPRRSLGFDERHSGPSLAGFLAGFPCAVGTAWERQMDAPGF
jgi:hypothetical protein